MMWDTRNTTSKKTAMQKSTQLDTHTHTHSIQQVTHKEKLPIYTQPTQFEIWIKPTYIKSMFDSSVA